MKDLAVLAEALGHDFTDIGYLHTAMVHRSYVAEHLKEGSNERFEFLGDAVLQLVVTDFIFREYPNLPEGELAKIRSACVNGDLLREVAEELGVGRHLLLGRGEVTSGGRTKASILADAMEAILAAVYLDAGLKVCEELIMRLWEVRIRARSTAPGRRDFKTRLQELLAVEGQRPKYRIIADGPDHEKSFTATLTIDGRQVGVGTGHSKKEAEQHAAEQALSAMEPTAVT